MKLTTVTHVSLDGVMQGLGRSDEDPRGGFERGGWALPLFNGESEQALNDIFERADAFLFGRETFEIFAGSWGQVPDPQGKPIAGPLNTRPKYVASNTLTDPDWAHSTVLDGDLEAAVTALKVEGEGEIQIHGSGALIRQLFELRLVDELILLVYPVVVGQGTRLFPAKGPDSALELVESRPTAEGITVQVYRPSGRPEYATTGGPS